MHLIRRFQFHWNSNWRKKNQSLRQWRGREGDQSWEPGGACGEPRQVRHQIRQEPSHRVRLTRRPPVYEAPGFWRRETAPRRAESWDMPEQNYWHRHSRWKVSPVLLESQSPRSVINLWLRWQARAIPHDLRQWAPRGLCDLSQEAQVPRSQDVQEERDSEKVRHYFKLSCWLLKLFCCVLYH